MKNFPENKYNYITFEKDGVKYVVAESTYRGKRVKGVAKCSPDDSYNEFDGKQLAAARCNRKVCERRRKWLEAQYAWVRKEVDYWHEQEKKIRDRYFESCRDLLDAQEKVEKVQNML